MVSGYLYVFEKSQHYLPIMNFGDTGTERICEGLISRGWKVGYSRLKDFANINDIRLFDVNVRAVLINSRWKGSLEMRELDLL
jgi:hypothetical protein